jgi:hypothetical protein
VIRRPSTCRSRALNRIDEMNCLVFSSTHLGFNDIDGDLPPPDRDLVMAAVWRPLSPLRTGSMAFLARVIEKETGK